MQETDPLILEYVHIKEKPREAEALKTLQKIASLVKPIMRQRGWRVPTLAEFYPEERYLLGVNWNHGQKICLRLRYPSDERQFLPMEQIVDTMLHELSHIVHGPHNAQFHALWQQLRDEHEQLVRKGYTGEGFLSKGRVLGGRKNHIPMDEARRRARAAAEKRRVLTAGSGQRLGGAPVRRGKDIRSVIADAAERRITVMKGCGSSTGDNGTGDGEMKDIDRKKIVDDATRKGFRTRAEEDDANERAIMQAYIEILQEEEQEKWGERYKAPSRDNPEGSAGALDGDPPPLPPSSSRPTRTDPSSSSSAPPARRQRPVSDSSTASSRPTSSSDSNDDSAPVEFLYSRPVSKNGPPSPASHAPSNISSKSTKSSDTWTCSICTLENPLDYLCCDACGTEREEDLSSASKATSMTAGTCNGAPPVPSASRPAALGWACHSCGTFMETQWWTCSRCGVMKLSS